MTPSACALQIALPLTEAEAIQDLKAGPNRHFATTMLSDVNGVRREYGSSADKRGLEQQFADTLAAVKAANVAVASDGSFESFGPLFEAREGITPEVVTLLAHWKGHEVEPADVLDVPALQKFLLRDRLGSQLPPTVIPLLSAPRLQAEQLRELLRALNELLPEPPKPGVTSHKLTLAYRGRARLNDALGPALMPGNRIEFRDGYNSPEELADAIPGDFRGILDLMVCTSAEAAEVLKARHGRGIRVRYAVRPLLLGNALLQYKYAVWLMSRTQCDYITAMDEIGQGIKTTLEDRRE